MFGLKEIVKSIFTENTMCAHVCTLAYGVCVCVCVHTYE